MLRVNDRMYNAPSKEGLHAFAGHTSGAGPSEYSSYARALRAL